MALDKQTIGVTLVDGLDTKNDLRTLVPGKLTAANNLSLSEQGTLARVDPRLSLVTQSGLDAVYTRKSELLGTVSRNLYAYEARTKTAIDHGRMSGVVVRTDRLFTAGAEQYGGARYQDCFSLDVAFYKASTQPGGLACYVWTERGQAAGNAVLKGYVRLVDQATGTTILGPTTLSSNATIFATRVVATSTAFLIFWVDTTGTDSLYCSVIQYSAPTTIGSAVALRTDISTDPCLDVFTSAFNASANAFAVYTSNDATYSVRAIKVTQSAGVPSVSAGPTDVEAVANTTAAQVSSVAIANCANTPLYGIAILAASAAARPGLITAVLDDACAISQAAAQKDSAAGPDITRGKRASVAICPGNGQFQVLSDRREECDNTAAVYNIRTTTLSSANAITAGPAISFYAAVRDDGTNGPFLAGKPYIFNSRAYVPLEITGSRSTGSQLQNTWLLADVASHAFIARCLYGVSGPETFYTADTPNLLPSVVALAYNGENYVDHITATRQLVPSGQDWASVPSVIAGMTRVFIRTHYSTVDPATRPAWAEVAESAVFADAVGSTYAGPLPAPAIPAGAVNTNAAEASFLLFPESITVANSAVAVNPLSAVARRFSAVYEWFDGAGQRHQSAPAVEVAFTPDGVNQTTVTVPMLQATLMRQRCTLVLYMSESATGVLKRVSQPGSAGYDQLNDLAAAALSVNIQSTMALGEPLYTEDGTLDNDGPRPMSTACVHQGRILADVTDDPHKWQISQAPVTGFGLQWSNNLGGEVDPQKGRIVAVASMDGRGILFRERGITVLNGNAPLSDGTGGSMSPEDLATDVGCMWPHSVCAFSGGVLFKSAKGWHVLDRSLNVVYVGEGPAAYDAVAGSAWTIDAASNSVFSAALSDTRKEIRVEGQSNDQSKVTLIYNYERGKWTTAGTSCMGSVWWPASLKFVASGGSSPGNITGAMASASGGFGIDLPLKYLNGAITASADSGYSPITASFTTVWLKPSEAIQGYQRVWWVELAGSVADGSTTPGSTLTVTLEMVTPDGTTSQTYAFTTNNLIASGQTTWQARCKPTVQKVQAIRVSASDVPTGAGGGVNFSGLTLVVGAKRGAARAAAAKTL